MRYVFGAFVAVALIASGNSSTTLISSAAAQGYSEMSCGQLWYARNKIYADAGYCFKTARARRTFGAGCFPPYGRLSGYAKERVEDIKRWEARFGC